MQEVWLLGNTADIEKGSSFFLHFRQALERSTVPVHVLVNGDLIAGCEDGAPPQLPVEDLLKTVEGLSHVHMTIIPGDRDWDDSGKDGLKCVKALRKLVNSYDLKNVSWPIREGCPGPELIEINKDIVLLAINTQWWNHPYRKPIPADGDCDVLADYDVLEELTDAIEDNKNRNILIAGHFPLFSLGKYGGRFPLSAHLLPPVFGSIRVAYHQHVGNFKDISNGRFDEMAERLRDIAQDNSNLIFLSGHEHNQQVLFYRDNYLINSGAPTKADFAAHLPIALFSASKTGFIALDYYDDGEVQYRFNKFDGNDFTEAKKGLLFQSPCREKASGETPVNEVDSGCPEKKNIAVKNESNSLSKPSFITLAAGKHYSGNGLKKLFFGKHYRDSWVEEVRVPFLNLDTTYQGLSLLSRGGGRETKSLKLKTANGRQYVFRSVDKDPVPALDFNLRNTIFAIITRDHTSSEHPYGALPVASLLDHLGILHAYPQYYVIPDDPRLGRFHDEFAGMLGMLEERPSKPPKGQAAFGGADDIFKSYKLFKSMYNDHDVEVGSKEFARARLFDILIGDWSKHEDNWLWAGYKQDEGMLFRPIPRDRDNAFSNLDGILPWVADREWAVSNFEHFDYELKGVRSLTFQARHMDRFLANELDGNDWLEAAQFLKKQLSPEVIQQAVKKMPKEMYDISGREIENKLNSRLAELEQYAREYYLLLAKQVDVTGSNKKERFEVHRNADGSTDVKVFGLGKGVEKLIYDRKFLPSETKDIRLFGLHQDDEFLISGQASDAIKLRVIGGPGNDLIKDQSEIKGLGKTTFIYEKSQTADIQPGREGKRVDTWNDDLYYYDRTAFAYNTYLPLVLLNFSSFNGFTFGTDLAFTRRNFSKKDFSSKHRFDFDLSTLGNFTASYKGRFRHVVHKWDLLTGVTFVQPGDPKFFFGLGNNTSKDDDLFNQDYYLVTFKSTRLHLGLERDFWGKSNTSIIGGYEHNKSLTKENTILDAEANFFGAGSLDIFNISGTVELDFRDHQVFPSQGARLYAMLEGGLASGASYRLADLFLELFASTRAFPFTIGLKGGYSSSSDDVPFYKLPILGQYNGLRGFQKHRFAGDSRLYFNSELRLTIAKINTPVFPIKIGLRGFYDLGKIIQKDEKERDWHTSYGGGIFLIPISRSFTLSVLVGASEEESSIIGFQLGTNF